MTRRPSPIAPLFAVLLVLPAATVSQDRPSCDEEPEARDCVVVEEPDAQPPSQNVDRNGRPAVQPRPTPRPVPGAGR